jgi:riboflavin kinase/FMN adenylyltransferase
VRKTVIALGFFDGIHLGHAALLRRTSDVATAIGAEPAMLTFDTHPDELIGDVVIPLLTSQEERAAIVQEEFGIRTMISLRFDEELRNMEWEAFADRLIADFGASHFVVGHDFRFGRSAYGNSAKLMAHCARLGIGCDVIPAVTLDGITVSSTYIRALLIDGQAERAVRFIGRPHRLTDTVRFGYRLGRTIGAPTINMKFEPGVLIPKHGVYASRLRIEDDPSTYFAATNIGRRLTVADTSDVTVESFILDFDRIVYGKRVTLEFLRFLRPELKFDSLDALKAQIAADVDAVRLAAV